jgi:ACT domain-containing protein
MKKERAVITVIGEDHPGIIAAVTSACAELGINIEDLSQTVVQGILTMTLIVDITGKDLRELQRRLARVAEEQRVKIIAQHEDIFRYMHRI